MDLVIDFQCLKGREREIIVKEVGVTAVNEDFWGHWLMVWPYGAGELPSDIRIQNNWITRHHHGISWYDGDVPWKSFCRTLKDVSRCARRVYVRGSLKADIVREIIANDITDLVKDPKCPSFHNLPWSDKYCMHHGMLHNHLTYSCAFNNAARLREWLRKTQGREESQKEDSEKEDEEKEDESVGYGQSTNTKSDLVHSSSVDWGFSSRSNTMGVDETDGFCVQH